MTLFEINLTQARGIFIGISFLLYNTVILTAQTDSIPQNEILPFADQMPEFPGGPAKLYEYIFKEIKYPLVCANKGIFGTVILKFTVDTLGKLSNTEILRSVAPEIDAEAMRVVESMNHLKKGWEPGRHEGHPWW
jgi:TonB family protein